MRVLSTVSGVCMAALLSWSLWGFFTAGDYFANGSPWMTSSVFAAACLGAVFGYRLKKPTGRIVLVAAALLGITLFVAAPRGWWAHSPLSIESR